MASLKQKGDLAELKVAADLVAQGYRVLFPFGEDHSYDLAIDDGARLLRVQVKHTRSDGHVITAKCFTHSLTGGRVRTKTRYTTEHIDCLAIWDATTDRCFYLSAELLGTGRSYVYLRYSAPRNNQRRRIRWAADYTRLASTDEGARLDFQVEGP